jgi:hypothetical protein
MRPRERPSPKADGPADDGATQANVDSLPVSVGRYADVIVGHVRLPGRLRAEEHEHEIVQFV